MNSPLDHIWQYLVAALAGVGWLFRLESKVHLAMARVDELERRRLEDLDAINRSREEFLCLAKEMREDIKQVLKQQGGLK